MKKIIIISTLIILLLMFLTILFLVILTSGYVKFDQSVDVVGGRGAIGAYIYIDGKKVGIMEKRIFPRDFDPKKIHPRYGIKSTKKINKGEIFSTGESLTLLQVKRYAGFSFPPGAKAGLHKLTIISKRGEKLSKKINVRHSSENNIFIDFKKKTIRGSD